MTASEKIDRLLNYLGINPKVLSERLGYARPQIIYDLKKGKTKSISPSLASKITSVFPEISKMWLLTGEGEMLRKRESVKESAAYVSEARIEYERLSERMTMLEYQIFEEKRMIARMLQMMRKNL
ncbi:MAG: hypothetical protein LUC44_02070 [Prevotellaceae bacterium]|nr:hypothetical protein [Prevotellaceae bacterium]